MITKCTRSKCIHYKDGECRIDKTDCSLRKISKTKRKIHYTKVKELSDFYEG